ncbi:MAG: hypothetical protein OJJ21_04630 [Ferrovibrio sp.]|uniref:hypothetical protein n=1 Tax=Ferrovibrio sp. TaxID=1917215 RepID=UPI002629F8DA|nr:hypothetical protein [Ferrovibrio sp.]MCW0232865.1 hypothetical protein [Ferrovibrio sp.]
MVAREDSAKAVNFSALTVRCVLAGIAAILTIAPPQREAWATPELERATELLRQSEAEWRREDKAYRDAQQAGRLKPREQAEYAEFVAGLRVRLLEQCEVVRGIGGNAAVSDFECIRLGAPQRRIVLPDVSAVQTEEEKKAAIVAKLSDLEGKIDEALMKRQQEMKQEASASTATGAAGGRSAGGASGGAAGGQSGGGSSSGQTGSETANAQGEQRTPSGQLPSASASGGSPGSKGAGVPGTGYPVGQPPPTAGGPSDNQRGAPQGRADGGVDDDVVARQLREAAEKESDPTLKEKLWAEYRKYKGARK